MRTKDDLRDSIKKKFGTMSNFARIGGINRYDLQKMFARKDMNPVDRSVIEKALKLENKGHIDQDKLSRIKKAIDDAGGCYTFTKDNEGFPQRLTYMIYNGEQKRESKLYKRLLLHFKIEDPKKEDLKTE